MRVPRYFRTVVAIVTMFISSAAINAALHAQPISNKPISAIELFNYSYRLRSTPEFRNGEVANAGVLFADRSDVICYFVIRNRLEERQASKESDSLQLKIIRLDVGTSRVSEISLPAHPGLTSVMRTQDEFFVVRTGELLQLYDRDFKLLRERTLYNTGKYDEWNVRISPTGRTVLQDHYDPSGSLQEILNSALETLKVIRLGKLMPSFAISDTRVMAPDSSEHTILIREFGGPGPWQSIRRSDSGRCVADPVFVSDTTILNSCGSDTVVLSLTGEILMKEMPPKKQHFEGMVSVTPSGKYFAVSALRTKGGFMDYTAVKRSDTTVLVYNTELRKQIASIRLELGPHLLPGGDYAFALSPDGKRLAIMTDHLLKVYELPR